MRRNRKAEGVSCHRYSEGSAFWLNDRVTNHGAAGATYIGDVESAVCIHGERALAFRPAIVASICVHRSRGTATSANCKVIERAWRIAFAPILIMRSRRLVRDQSAMDVGKTNVRRKFAIL